MSWPKERNIKFSFRSGPAALHSFFKNWSKGRGAEKGDQERATRGIGSPGEHAANRGNGNSASRRRRLSAVSLDAEGGSATRWTNLATEGHWKGALSVEMY